MGIILTKVRSWWHAMAGSCAASPRGDDASAGDARQSAPAEGGPLLAAATAPAAAAAGDVAPSGAEHGGVDAHAAQGAYEAAAGDASAALERAVDRYVEQWFEQNPGVNMGVVDVPLVGPVDLLPDRLEKHIYKRVHTVLLTNLLHTEVRVLGVPLRLQLAPETAESE